MKLLMIFVFSWLAGLDAYLGALSAFWGQRISSGDFRAVVFWSALASSIANLAVYVPAMFALRALFASRGLTRWWTYPSVGIVLGVLPLLFILLVLGSNFGSDLLSAEARLFYLMFAASGAVFGIGFDLAYGRRSA